MAKGINPLLPSDVGGGSGVPILGGKKEPPQNTPPPEPWDQRNCYKLVIPLYNCREYYMAHGSQDPQALIGTTQTGVCISRSISYAYTPLAQRHQRIDIVGVGFVLEVVVKPDGFDDDWKRFFPEVEERNSGFIK